MQIAKFKMQIENLNHPCPLSCFNKRNVFLDIGRRTSDIGQVFLIHQIHPFDFGSFPLTDGDFQISVELANFIIGISHEVF